MTADDVLRAALEEYIRMGPDSRRPVEERLAARTSCLPSERASAIAEARRAVATAETLAREYQAGQRSQRQIIDELLRCFPWLSAGDGAQRGLAEDLGHFGYYLVIM